MQVRYRSVDVSRWRARSVDVSLRRCKCTETREKICRKKDRTDVKERQCGCTDVIQMCRCVGVVRWRGRSADVSV